VASDSLVHAGVICRWPSCLLIHHHGAMSNLFPCVELQRLRQQYENELHIWGQFEFPVHNEPVGPAARQAERLQLKQRALSARNEACERLLAHREKCQICKIEVRLAR
jgi:hypothetical protein